jgi:nucleotide-binding universal stress UspA family protein
VTNVTLKDLLVVVDSSAASDHRVELAASLAAEHGAHLIGLYVLPIPEPDRSEEETRIGRIIDDLIKMYNREEQELARVTQGKFEAAIEHHGIRGEWRTAGGFASEVAAVHARYVDLVIVGQGDPKPKRTVMPPLRPEEVALSAGRPVLVTPSSLAHARIGSRILVAWNARREATRAVNDALPLLSKAESVTVLVVDPEKWTIAPHGEEPGADIALHLARHGIAVQVGVTFSEDTNTGEVLRAKAREIGADLIVMGAYGHSRTRELILGGVTWDILHEMTVPVLMSH